MTSDTRVGATHVGSLPRPQAIVELVAAEDQGRELDRDRRDAAIAGAVRECVARQVDIGIDYVSDGEMSKVGYATYVRHRLSGFEVSDIPPATPADLLAFPTYLERLSQGTARPRHVRPVCRGPISYEHAEPVARDIAHLRAAIDGQPVRGAFINAPSPGTIALFQPNQFYGSHEDYLDAIGEAMRTEYAAIVASGLLLQIDAPDLAMGRNHHLHRHLNDDEFVALTARHVDAINAALGDLPGDRIRLHVCWGNYEGPHHLDIELELIIDELLRAKPTTLLFEAANPRHAHQWAVWRQAEIPDEKVLVPGLLDSTTNYIEHPQLVAQQLLRFIDIVGPERVIAGADCGFATWAGYGPVDPEIAWAKLAALTEGTTIANKQLAGRASG
jgi:5-methyltetrahydropteroyltriglutamate--homocysteine methyltransferase